MKKHLLSTIILVVYLTFLIKVMVFKDVPLIQMGSLILNFGGIEAGRPPNFLPFKTILDYLFGDKGLIIGGINLVGNIALLLPVGFFAPLVFRSLPWKKTLIFAVTVGLIIELMQWVLRVGIFDIDDVILNALGVMIGFWIFTILGKLSRSMKQKNRIIAVIIFTLSTLALAFYVFEKLPISFGGGIRKSHFDRLDNKQESRGLQRNPQEDETPQSKDLCNGTGGTGKIETLEGNAFTLERNDGVTQILHFSEQTDIRNSFGRASKLDLEIGQRVTVVVEDSTTASVIFVCKVSEG